VASTCNTLLAIIITALILNRDDDIDKFRQWLAEQGVKTPSGKSYLRLSNKIFDLVQGNGNIDDLLKNQIMFNNPMMRILVGMLGEIVETR
jgi:hypothetical protein